MKNLTRTKELLPAPENGSPSVNYYITSTHTEIDATESGAATVPGLEITLTQWKRVGQNPSVVSSDLYFGFVRIKDGVASPWGTPAKTTRLTLQGRDADTYNCIEARLWDDDWHVVSQFPINVKWKAKDGDNGDDAVTYEIRLSPSVVTRHNDNTFTPSSVVLSSYRKVGDGSPAAFSGYMTIQTATGYVVHSGTHSQYGLTPSASWDWPLKVKMWASIADANAEETPLAEESIHMVSDGESGDTQLMYYPAGEYSSIKTYTRTDRLCPVVLYNNYYYYLKVATNRVEGMAHDPTDSDYWGLATQFIFAIFQAVFAAFANLGSFVISGDFFISQYGTLYYNNGSTIDEIPVGDSNHSSTYGGQVPYTYFDSSDPVVNTDPASGTYKFRPTLMLNAKTGGTFQNDSYVRGELHATSGTFQNVNISGQSTFGGLLRKSKTIINAQNITNYATYVSSSIGYLISLVLTGTWMEVQGFSDDITLHIPSLCRRITRRYDIDFIRSLVGNTVMIYCNGAQQNIVVNIKGWLMDASTSIFYEVASIQPGQFIELTCKMTRISNMETIYWEYQIGDIET